MSYEDLKQKYLEDTREGHPNFEHKRIIELLDALKAELESAT